MSDTEGRTAPKYSELPLVYSCSGCSSAAQLANTLAVRLDRRRLAEMSCIAGVGGGVDSLVRTARKGRKILALDGCALHCVRHCLEQAGVEPDSHLDLSTAGVRKRYHADAVPEEVERVWDQVVAPAARALAGDSASGPTPTPAPAPARSETQLAGLG